MIFFKREAYVFISLFTILLVGCKKDEKGLTFVDMEPTTALQQYYLKHSRSSLESLYALSKETHIDSMRGLYKQARMEFKYIEPIMAFVDSENHKFLNQPNILKIEEEDFTDVKIKEPSGFQVLEEELYAEIPNLGAISQHALNTAKRLELIHNNLNLNFLKEYHILWIVRDQIIRTALLGITGFDSPVLENSLKEAKTSYTSLLYILEMHENHFKSDHLLKAWKEEITLTIKSLDITFNEFDRYEFIKTHTNKSFDLWNQTVEDWNVDFPFERAFKNDMSSLFSMKTFNMEYFSSEKIVDSLSNKKIALGKELFFDPSFSTSRTMSCSSCHDPKLAYTDGLKVSKGQTRNSPTLLYSALQKSFFYDTRTGSLEGQIVSVVENESEFHTDLHTFESLISANPNYNNSFQAIYGEKANQHNIRNAMASFIKSLTPFNSKFDRNMNALESTLTASEINGFNLFMGKAKCATCHFAPIFNGTVPTQYKETELEVIGVPKTTDTLNAEIDDDYGRYYVYNTEERKHFFKTPTVRNSSKTSPYMHNGVYSTLKEVLDFYNKGGAAGLGIELDNQTLPPDALNLSPKEIEDLEAFLKTLEDDDMETKAEAY